MEIDQTPGRVLLVDDEQTVCQLMDEVLVREGYECRSCVNGKEALSVLKEDPFDVVVADLYMPGISGMTLMEEGRKMRPQPTFVMATGETDAHVSVQAMKSGAVDYLIKPFPMTNLVESVRWAFENHRKTTKSVDEVHRLETSVSQRKYRLQKALKEINRAYEETIETLGTILDIRGSESLGHAQRVLRYAIEIAKRMGVPDYDRKDFARAALLHDIGKIGVPEEILLKPGKLTPEEMAVMRTHVVIGYNLLKNLEYFSSTATIVLAHHERYDSHGYPRSIGGTEIPLEARIFAVADTLDAITTDRPYRKARSFADARAEIIAESGRQFDPIVVKSFLSIPNQTWYEIRQEVDGLLAEGCWPSAQLP